MAVGEPLLGRHAAGWCLKLRLAGEQRMRFGSGGGHPEQRVGFQGAGWGGKQRAGRGVGVGTTSGGSVF